MVSASSGAQNMLRLDHAVSARVAYLQTRLFRNCMLLIDIMPHQRGFALLAQGQES
jgi:hypothetical protein